MDIGLLKQHSKAYPRKESRCMRLVIYTNILTPYRKYTYDLMYQFCKEKGADFLVLVMAQTEGNRSWTYDELEAPYTVLLKGVTFSKGETYIHFNWYIKKIIREFKPDLVVCAGSYLCPGAWQIAYYKKKFHYKCLFWSESHLKEQKDHNNIKIEIREFIRKRFYPQYDGFWYAGKLSKEFIAKYASNSAKYYFVPNLVDESIYGKAYHISKTQKQNIRRSFMIEDSKKILFCPARLSPVKGILEFLDILDKIVHKRNIVLLIAGDGELKEKIEHKAKERHLDVRLLGNKSQDEVVKLYSISDVFVLPSLSDPNPLTCIEALWAGLPLFISNHCGNYPEVINQGDNGYVFDYEDIETASKLLEKLLSRKEIMKEKSVYKAKNQYNSEMVIRRIINECFGICSE